jgi:hypothetical protein
MTEATRPALGCSVSLASCDARAPSGASADHPMWLDARCSRQAQAGSANFRHPAVAGMPILCKAPWPATRVALRVSSEPHSGLPPALCWLSGTFAVGGSRSAASVQKHQQMADCCLRRQRRDYSHFIDRGLRASSEVDVVLAGGTDDPFLESSAGEPVGLVPR